MPLISKSVVAQLENGCERKLLYSLYPEQQQYFMGLRQSFGMPGRSFSDWSGQEAIRQNGVLWEVEKLEEIKLAFEVAGYVSHDGFLHPEENVNMSPHGHVYMKKTGEHNDSPFGKWSLTADFLRSLPTSRASILFQPEFFPMPQDEDSIHGTFSHVMGLDVLDDSLQEANAHLGIGDRLEHSSMVPDLLLVLPARQGRATSPMGEILPIQAGDKRRPLQIVDIKESLTPGRRHFCEVALYTLGLASWLVDNGLDGEFYVSDMATVLHGSHTMSHLMTRYQEGVTNSEALLSAMQEDCSPIPLEIFLPPILNLYRETIPHCLQKRKEWWSADYHIDGNCSFCEYSGNKIKDEKGNFEWECEDHCLPMASHNHLSKIEGLTKGARKAMAAHGLETVEQLAALDFSSEVGLSLRQSNKTIAASYEEFSVKAKTMTEDKKMAFIDEAGMMTRMPYWCDLRIYLHVGWSSIHDMPVSLGVKAFWDKNQKYASELVVIEENTPMAERDALKKILDAILDIVRDATSSLSKPTWQFFIWSQKEHDGLGKLERRHQDILLSHPLKTCLGWLFPQEELPPSGIKMASHNIKGDHLVIVVSDIVRANLALNIDFSYTLLATARLYKASNKTIAAPPAGFFSPLSSDIPEMVSARIWSPATSDKEHLVEDLRRTQNIYLDCLIGIVGKLTEDLRGQDGLFVVSPPIPSLEEEDVEIHPDLKLLIEHNLLNGNLDIADKKAIRALPLSERLAKHKCALLTRRLDADEAEAFLHERGLVPCIGRWVYVLNEDSKEVTAKEDDINWAIAPADKADFLDDMGELVKEAEATLDIQLRDRNGANPFAVSIVLLDRQEGMIVIDLSNKVDEIVALENHHLIDLSRNVVLNPWSVDIFSHKLRATIRDISRRGLSQESISHPRTIQDIKPSHGKTAPVFPHVCDVLWNTESLSMETFGRSTQFTSEKEDILPHEMALMKTLRQMSLTPNDSQAMALKKSLMRRIHLIWGPPGTGKSYVLTCLLMMNIIAAMEKKRRLRILITASTWTAIDNILSSLLKTMDGRLDDAWKVMRIYRLRSALRGDFPISLEGWRESGKIIDMPNTVTSATKALKYALDDVAYRGMDDNQPYIDIVAATTHQIYNLSQGGREWFDEVVIDEGSQLSVAMSLLALNTMAKNAHLICAGDLLQLPPINRVEMSESASFMTGSIYGFLKRFLADDGETQLNVNTRSNEEIINTYRYAGYGEGLCSHSPQMRIKLLGRNEDNDAKHSKHAMHAIDAILTPSIPVTCVTYRDGRSTQSNLFEAQLVCRLIERLWEHGLAGLQDEMGFPGRREDPIHPLSMSDFWTKGVGIVTPHRAQKMQIINLLIERFPQHPVQDIIAAVDTVERFQGQERAVIIASYAVGEEAAITSEADFLFDVNRLNVTISRARGKFIFLSPMELVEHLPQDRAVMEKSLFLKGMIGICSHVMSSMIDDRDISIRFYNEQAVSKTIKEKSMKDKPQLSLEMISQDVISSESLSDNALAYVSNDDWDDI